MQLTTHEKQLLLTLKNLVTVERKTLSDILKHLQIVYDTRLFAKLGYSSLHKYLIKELGYSESAAFRRVQALKLVKEIPSTKKMIENGSLNLSGITQLQTMLKDKSTEVKKEAIEKVKNISTAEARTTLFELAPEKETHPRDHRKQVSATHERFSMTLSKTAMEKIEKVKAQTKKYENEDLMNYLLDLALATHAKKQNIVTKKVFVSKNVRTISTAVKREVFKRAGGKCEHPNCQAIHYLEYDHRNPVALGGGNNFDNIRLVCKAHNQLYAIQKLGLSQMQRFL
jgi:hypothetical protein